MEKCLSTKQNELFKMEIKNSNILDVEVKNYGECGYCKETKEILKVSWNIYSQWLFLLNKFKDKEWGGVLKIKDKTIIDFQIPEQEVKTTECEFKEELGGEGIIHSHHTMGAFHSSQDDNHARNLYEYSIVISQQGIIATKRRKLPCEGFGYINVDIEVIDLPNIDLSKIKEKQYDIFPDYEDTYSPHLKLPEEIESKNQCYSCFKENIAVKFFRIEGNGVYLCKECEEYHFKTDNTERDFCDSCMQNFPLNELSKYMGGIVCNQCWEEFIKNE